MLLEGNDLCGATPEEGRRCTATSASTQPRQQRRDKRQRLKPRPRLAVKLRLLPAQSFGASSTPATSTSLIAPIWLLFIDVRKKSRRHSYSEVGFQLLNTRGHVAAALSIDPVHLKLYGA